MMNPMALMGMMGGPPGMMGRPPFGPGGMPGFGPGGFDGGRGRGGGHRGGRGGGRGGGGGGGHYVSGRLSDPRPGETDTSRRIPTFTAVVVAAAMMTERISGTAPMMDSDICSSDSLCSLHLFTKRPLMALLHQTSANDGRTTGGMKSYSYNAHMRD